MRRKDREITEPSALRAIIAGADVCRIAFAVDNVPYIVPMNFGYGWDANGLTLYFHSANQGRKLDCMRNNPNVCFEMDLDHELVAVPKACGWGMNYKSIIGRGRLEIVTDQKERKSGLAMIMDHYGGNQVDFDEKTLTGTTVLRLKVEKLSGKQKR